MFVWQTVLARMLLKGRDVDGRQALEDALDEIYRDGAGWRLRAELDPPALVQLASSTARRVGVSCEVALRVIESELGLPPTIRRRVPERAPTRRDLRAITV